MRKCGAFPERGCVRPLLLVLTVIEDPNSRAIAKIALEGAGHRVVAVERIAQAQALLSNGLDPDFLLCEGFGLNSSSTDPIRALLEFAPASRICVIADIHSKVLREKTSQLGIRHFITKPLTRGDLDSLVDTLNHLQADSSSDRNPVSFAEKSGIRQLDSRAGMSIPDDMPSVPYIEELGGNNFFLAASPQMLEIHRQVKLLADLDVNVLILGESGTGKEVIAQLIHKNSRRSREKFVKVNWRGVACGFA